MVARSIPSRSILMALSACLLVCAPMHALAQVKQQAVKLSPSDGCFRYSGDAVEFIGRFKAGSYIGVSMSRLDASGLPRKPEEEERIPLMDAPDFKPGVGVSWFGPLPESRVYTVTFMPMSEFGWPAIVNICGRTAPPSL